jgi:hypothetical protein
VLARPRYGRSQIAGNEGRAGVAGHRHGSRTRSLTGTFGPIEIAVPRARLNISELGRRTLEPLPYRLGKPRRGASADRSDKVPAAEALAWGPIRLVPGRPAGLLRHQAEP